MKILKSMPNFLGSSSKIETIREEENIKREKIHGMVIESGYIRTTEVEYIPGLPKRPRVPIIVEIKVGRYRNRRIILADKLTKEKIWQKIFQFARDFKNFEELKKWFIEPQFVYDTNLTCGPLSEEVDGIKRLIKQEIDGMMERGEIAKREIPNNFCPFCVVRMHKRVSFKQFKSEPYDHDDGGPMFSTISCPRCGHLYTK